MATKISELTSASTLDGSELIPVVQGGVTKSTSVTDLVSGGELPAYSTSETLTTERWTDGKPIYSKVINHTFGVLDTVNLSAVISTNINEITSAEWVITDSLGRITGGEGHDEGSTLADHYSVQITALYELYAKAMHVYWVNQSCVATISYTKTTDTAASPVAGVTVTSDNTYGSWAPTIYGSSTAGTYTLGPAACGFAKIGRLVTLNAYIYFTAASGGSGDMRIGNLPYPISNGVDQNYGGVTGPVTTHFVNMITSDDSPTVKGASSSELGIMGSRSNNTGWNWAPMTGFSASTHFNFTVSYLTD